LQTGGFIAIGRRKATLPHEQNPRTLATNSRCRQKTLATAAQLIDNMRQAWSLQCQEATLMSQTDAYCSACGAQIDARAEICPKCGVRQKPIQTIRATESDPAIKQASGTKLAAGLCGIFLGGLGIHKFVYGATTPGIIMLLVSVLTCGLGYPVMHVIGLVEGIIYLTKTDEEFYETYVMGQKGWF
jgi:TM2 domain-containing membrane protein YozV